MQTALLVIAVGVSVVSLVMSVLQCRTMRKEIALFRAQVQHSPELTSPELDAGVGANTAHTGLTPVALSQLAATLSTVLGRDVRVTPASDLPTSEEPHHSWAQQGCVSIQNSHDLSAAKHPPQTAVSARRTVSPTKKGIA